MNIALWIIQILLAAAYLMAGVMKTFRPIDQLAPMMKWAPDVPVPLVRFIGIAEILGAFGLVLPMLTGVAPWLTVVAALGFVVIQVLAAILHLRRGEASVVPMNVVLFVLALAIAYGRLVVV